MAAELTIPLRMAQVEVQRYLRNCGIPEVKITYDAGYTALATQVDNASGSIRPLEMWEKASEAADETLYRRVLEAANTELDMLEPGPSLTLWRWDGGVVAVKPCLTDRWYRLRGMLYTTGTTEIPWNDMVIGVSQVPDELWIPVFNLAAAEWLRSHDKGVLAKAREEYAFRQLEAMKNEHARYKQKRLRRRRPYRS